MNKSRTNRNKVYGLFYKDHGNWRLVNVNNPVTLEAAQDLKPRVRRQLKSSVIIRRVRFS
jgi:hypothetical protein